MQTMSDSLRTPVKDITSTGDALRLIILVRERQSHLQADLQDAKVLLHLLTYYGIKVRDCPLSQCSVNLFSIDL